MNIRYHEKKILKSVWTLAWGPQVWKSANKEEDVKVSRKGDSWNHWGVPELGTVETSKMSFIHLSGLASISYISSQGRFILSLPSSMINKRMQKNYICSHFTCLVLALPLTRLYLRLVMDLCSYDSNIKTSVLKNAVWEKASQLLYLIIIIIVYISTVYNKGNSKNLKHLRNWCIMTLLLSSFQLCYSKVFSKYH